MKLFASLLFLLARLTSSQHQQLEQEGVCSSDDGTCTKDNFNELIVPQFPPDFVDPCTDTEVNCPRWAREGECRFNPAYMLRSCAASCGTCQFISKEDYNSKSAEGEEEEESQPICIDLYDECDMWANDEGECWINLDCKFGTTGAISLYFPPSCHRPPLSSL